MSIKDVFEYKQGEYQDLSKVEQEAASTNDVLFIYRGIGIAGYNINLFDDSVGTTQLILDTDYSLLYQDVKITGLESENIFAGYNVINAAYQNVSLFLDIRCIGGYTKFTGGTYEDVSTPQTITLPSFGHTVYVDTSSGDIALTINDASRNNDTITIVSKGANDTTLTMTGIVGGIIPGGEARTFLWVGSSWYLVSDGVDGISIIWQGSLSSAPASPELNWGYYNTVLLKSYIWDGDSWEIIAIDGTNGVDGISIVWQGSLAAAPGSPELNWAYYDTTDKKSYTWDGDSWEILAQDGTDGVDGDTLLPIGFIYTQYPGKSSPSTLGLLGTWSNISSTFAGDFFRAEGGNASAFESGQQTNQNKSHTHVQNSHNHTQNSHNHTQNTHVHTMGTHRHKGGGLGAEAAQAPASFYPNGYYSQAMASSSAMTSANAAYFGYTNYVDPGDTNTKVATNIATTSTNIATTATNQTDGGTEARPVNRTIRVWERTS